MQNILIIGGSYFVGRVFVEELLKRGAFHIHVLNRGRIPIRRDGVTEIVCDRHDLQGMKAALPAVHWDAVVDFCTYAPEDIAESLEVLPSDEVEQYVYISTASVYDHTLNLPIREDAAKLSGPQPELGPAADYGYDKWRAELTLQEQCSMKGIHHTSIRPAFIYGKYNYAPRESHFFDLLINNEPVVIPENSLALFSFVSVWDVAALTIGCLGNSATYNRAFNASAEELVSYPRLMETLKEVTGISPRITPMSIDEIEARQIPLPFPLDEHLIYDGTLLKGILDFHYTSFHEGMAETYRYYRAGRGLD
jgi:nucleoside-diphosphate-sugar epimerase